MEPWMTMMSARHIYVCHRGGVRLLLMINNKHQQRLLDA